MKKNFTFKVNTQYKSIEDFKHYFYYHKKNIKEEIKLKLNINKVKINNIKLHDNHSKIFEINYNENTKLYKPIFFNLSIQIDEYNKLIELVINEIITKYIIIIRSKYDVDTLIKNNFNLLKENEILKKKLDEKKKRKKKTKKKRLKKKVEKYNKMKLLVKK